MNDALAFFLIVSLTMAAFGSIQLRCDYVADSAICYLTTKGLDSNQ